MNKLKHPVAIECPRCDREICRLEEVAPGLYTMPEVLPDEMVCKLWPLREKLWTAIRSYGTVMYEIGLKSGGGHSIPEDLDRKASDKFNKILKLLGPWAKIPKGVKK